MVNNSVLDRRSNRNVWKCFCTIAQWQIVRFEHFNREPPCAMCHTQTHTHTSIKNAQDDNKVFIIYIWYFMCARSYRLYVSEYIGINTASNSENLLTSERIFARIKTEHVSSILLHCCYFFLLTRLWWRKMTNWQNNE